ncbi:hypothetical protein D9Q98_007060 [Chlorella vulgaris]|uniref:Methyltransferase FkbM domain-containing protein n=1 Tax=Chlorella vulgaris TaxID=3077 RepID=A0A9D4TJF0_CHLVU|nr:hypothetical protein D9Q98_007060 [Chlorella vulgaris]
MQHFYNSSAQGTHWRLMQASVGSKSSSSGPFCDVGESGSNCSTAVPGSGHNSEDVDVVAATTVDELLAMQKFDRIDLLKIDAGGEEVAALSGAIASIAGGRVGVLAFACGGQGAWKHGQLGEVVARLDELGYTCYLAGQETQHGSLARLTGCWRPSYETQHRSTAVCVPRGHLLYPHTERMSLRYGLHEQVYFKQLQAAPAQQSEAAAAAGGKELDSQQKLSAGQPEGVHQAVTAGMSGQPIDPGSDADVHLPPLVDDGGSQVAEQVAETSQLDLWAANPEATSFTAPSSRCTLHPNSTVQLAAPPLNTSAGVPFLFDIASMPSRNASCAHCPAREPAAMPPCCGVCVFAKRKCVDFYPGKNVSERVAKHLVDSGNDLENLSPCELFARIRGRTLWLAGDSQMWNFYYALECFLREFAPSLQRTPPLLDPQENRKLVTVWAPVPYPAICLDLALGTRVCVVRVDAIWHLKHTVIPRLQAHTPHFREDLFVFNFGLHYPLPAMAAVQTGNSFLARGLRELAAWRKARLADLPAFIWVDTAPQHFNTSDGTYPGGKQPFACVPLQAWHSGKPTALAGGRYNLAAAPIVPNISDAHLHIWNGSAPLWRSHWPGECSHWCHPGPYQLWLFLLNDLLQRQSLGSPVEVPGRSAVQQTQAQHRILLRSL